MNIVFLDAATVTLGDVDYSALRALGEYAEYDRTEPSQTVSRCKSAQVAICNKVRFTKDVIQALPDLKLICIVATGVNNVDLAAAREAGVQVCNVPNYATRSVAQHTFAMILGLATRLVQYHCDVLAGEWSAGPLFTLLKYPTFELAGKTIGIVGFGAIGREVARLAEVFGMNVKMCNRSGLAVNGRPCTPLDTLLSESDVVSIHCPLTEQTRNRIDADALQKMKKSALLINMARGGIVNEQALADALNTGAIAGAAVDVLTQEPPPRDHPLLHAKNILISPHSAWATTEARQRLVEETAENIRSFQKGQDRNRVT